jgi:NADH-quinone oxidoreductase subunit L
MDASAVQHVAETGAKIQDLAWFVLLAPLIGALGTHFLTRKDRFLTALFAIGTVVTSFALSVALFGTFGHESVACSSASFLHIGALKIDIGLHLDGLANLMLVVVTGVSSVVMIFSTGYMHGDAGYSRFFSTLCLFVFSMLGIVLADNFVMLFVFWELVGVSSYLLIGFWYDRAAAGDAAKKAFITNRLGDFGFILGILIVWSATGSVNFGEVGATLSKNPAALGSMASLAGVLVFMGAMGKSAQFPLHVWLPDAMEGPTPVSALIHAATMVAAGVYMLCRVFFLYQIPPAWPEALSFLGNLSAGTIISWIGGVTALFAAVIAVQQNDIKRILAYSTLSQLGYMVMAVGLGSKTGNPAAGMYHLFTHAFFKALLFLGAGSVIHACHHQQDIWKMGGLWKRMPRTFWAFAVGTAALAGLPPFSGFYSKDEILMTAMSASPVLFGLAVVVAALTTFYMTRLVIVAFFGGSRSDDASHAEESPASMTTPLLVLAVPSLLAGWLGVGSFLSHHFQPGREFHLGNVLFGPFDHAPLAATFSLGAVLFGASAAWSLYWGVSKDPLPGRLGRFARAMREKFYFDEIYDGLLIPAHDTLAAVAGWFDRWIISGLVTFVSGTTDLAGRALRLVQTGNLQTYAFLFTAGVALIIYLALK